MSKLISEYCELLKQEPVKTVSVSLKLNSDEYKLIEDFQSFVVSEIKAQTGSDKTPQISFNDLAHKLILNGIRSERKFKKYSQKSSNKGAIQ